MIGFNNNDYDIVIIRQRTASIFLNKVALYIIVTYW